MFNIENINNKLKYIEFYNMPDEKWDNYYFYSSLNNDIVNDYNWLNTFKDKIHFELLYFCKNNINIQLIEQFIKLYDIEVWPALFSNYSHIFTEDFFNKHYYDIKWRDIPVNILCKLDKDKLVYDVKYLLFANRVFPYVY